MHHFFGKLRSRLLAGYACAALAFVAPLGIGSLRAELIILKTGGQAEGELLNADRSAQEPIRIRTPEGLKVTFAPDQVQRIIHKSDLQKQYEALASQCPDTVEAHWELAEWCRQAELAEPRQQHLESILRLDPLHEGAHLALGYGMFGGQWVKPDEWMRSQGYVRYQGGWRTRQEVEIDVRARQFELAQKQWLQNVKQWVDQIARGRRGEDALANLKAIKDPAAGPALLDVLSDTRQPTYLRLLCLDLITTLPGTAGTAAMIKLALEEPDAQVRDRALDELQKRQSVAALVAFTKLLTDKDNKKVQRAGYCLGRLRNPEATLALIEALNTTHHYLVSPGGPPPGGIGAAFGGGPGGGGLGGMAMGGRPKDVKIDQQNDQVRGALSAMHPAANFGYNEDRWRAWYAETFTTTDVDLRRE